MRHETFEDKVNSAISFSLSYAVPFHPRAVPPTTQLRWLVFGSSPFFLTDRFLEFLFCVHALPA
jgi:hypothetical protein